MNPNEWKQAIEQSWIVRFPKQSLTTFGVTNISYYVVTEPLYSDAIPSNTNSPEGVVRTGRVIAEKPAIITPTYGMNLEGFSDEAYEFLGQLSRQYGGNSPGILYKYRNEAFKTDIVSGSTIEIAHKIRDDLDNRKENLAVVMVGVDACWDIVLLKFIYEFTSSSARHNINEMQLSGVLDPIPELGGAPKAAKDQIEKLFRKVESGGNAEELKQELDRWGLFEHYQDRFLRIFRMKNS
ncbi:MAG: hypothetical protein MK359_03995 [SAR202 cluster bacterium]|nr:hypothetical protein [SAR202 cluster bacterium]|tara:strand:- start:9242 stop:9955 length:714 start_codon:yes stop_codon:yes gene_type:complete